MIELEDDPMSTPGEHKALRIEVTIRTGID
jgi:hypothetical protein